MNISKSAFVIDNLSLLYLIFQNCPSDLLLLIKNISCQQPTLFPFYACCDFNLVQNDDFETLCLKMANGKVKVEKQTGSDILVQTTAIKPGSRFAEETGVISLSTAHGLRLMGNKPEALKKFVGADKVEQATA